MSESNAGTTPLVENTKPAEAEQQQTTKVDTPTKRTPKRKADAFKKESEELLKTLGVSLEMELEDGRRRTRSSARGTPSSVPTTPPAKRARGAGASNTPKQKEESKSPETTTTPKKRGTQGERKRLLVLMDPALPKEYTDTIKNSETDSNAMDTTVESTAAATTTSDVTENDAGKTSEVPVSAKGARKDKDDVKEKGDKIVEEPAKEEQKIVVCKEKKEVATVVEDKKDTTSSSNDHTDAGDAVKEEVELLDDKGKEDSKKEDAQKEDPAMEVDDEVKPSEKKDNKVVIAHDGVAQPEETKSDETNEKKETVTEEEVAKDCESNGSNTVNDVITTSPKEASEATEVATEETKEKLCQENDKTEEGTVKVNDSNAVEDAAPTVVESMQEKKDSSSPAKNNVDDTKSTGEVKDTVTVADVTTVNSVAETNNVEKAASIEVETKTVSSEEATTKIDPAPTPQEKETVVTNN